MLKREIPGILTMHVNEYQLYEDDDYDADNPPPLVALDELVITNIRQKTDLQELVVDLGLSELKALTVVNCKFVARGGISHVTLMSSLTRLCLAYRDGMSDPIFQELIANDSGLLEPLEVLVIGTKNFTDESASMIASR